jgi:hypothetical protein
MNWSNPTIPVSLTRMHDDDSVIGVRCFAFCSSRICIMSQTGAKEQCITFQHDTPKLLT